MINLAVFQVTQKTRLARLVLFAAFHNAQNPAITVLTYADRHQNRGILYFTTRAALQDHPIQIDIGMITLDRPVTPRLVLFVDPLVELGNGPGADSHTAQRLSDVLHPANRHARPRYISISASSTEAPRRL